MEVPKPKFRLMKNGYDRFAVDDTVDRLLFENETMRQQLDSYRNQVDHAATQFSQIKSRYQALVSELKIGRAHV